jgi:hypothetical protein
VRAVNITNPAAPVEDGYFDGVPQSRGIAADGAFVYAAEKGDGLSVYKNDLVTAIDEQATAPVAFALLQNYPNPFNPTTTIGIQLPERSFVTLEVINLLGQRVAVLVNQQLPAGAYTVPFNSAALPSGLYFYRLQANDFSAVRKMMLLK